MKKDINSALKETAEKLFELTGDESSALVDYALGEISTQQTHNVKRKPRFPVQTCLWLNQESIAIVELLTRLAKQSGQLSHFERKQDYIRNLLIREFVKNISAAR